MFERGAGALERALDVLERLNRLRPRIPRPDQAPIVSGRGRAGDVDDTADANGPRIADEWFPFRAGRDVLSVGMSDSSQPAVFEAQHAVARRGELRVVRRDHRRQTVLAMHFLQQVSAASSAVCSSRSPVGSSARSSVGRITSARAMATRCCSPPDSMPGRCSSRSARPTRSSRSVARSRHSAALACGRSAAASRRSRGR